jgi:hypothetical protein
VPLADDARSDGAAHIAGTLLEEVRTGTERRPGPERGAGPSLTADADIARHPRHVVAREGNRYPEPVTDPDGSIRRHDDHPLRALTESGSATPSLREHGPMAEESCPRCQAMRIGAFRYCTFCAFDFDERVARDAAAAGGGTRGSAAAVGQRADRLGGLPIRRLQTAALLLVVLPIALISFGIVVYLFWR